ncbi:MAG: lysophospholipid acyltransferase family protein [Chloroflexota bacterium]
MSGVDWDWLGASAVGRAAHALSQSDARRLSRFAGDLAWLRAREGRAAVGRNLAQVMGRRDAAWASAVRGTFQFGAWAYLDLLALAATRCEDVERRFVVRGWEHLEGVLAEGRGAIVAQIHFSAAIVGAQLFPCRGVPFTAPVERVGSARSLAVTARLRSGLGIRALPIESGTPAQLLACLGRNEVVGLMVDRDVTGGGRPVQFFGRPARLPVGAAVLAMRSGAPILPGVVIRRPDGLLDGIMGEPIRLHCAGAAPRGAVALTQRVIARAEPHIARHPRQWSVFQDVWAPAGLGTTGESVGACALPCAGTRTHLGV